jgi:hypothetical protein
MLPDHKSDNASRVEGLHINLKRLQKIWNDACKTDNFIG